MASQLSADPHAGQPVLQSGAPIGEASRVIILLHGRGASADDILPLGEALARGATYLAPEAAGSAWYPQSFLAPIAANQPYLSSALRRLELLLAELDARGIDHSRVILAGFSQGACLASEFAATHPKRYAGVVAFTGGLIGPLGSDVQHTGDLAGTPVYFGAGDPDPHVPWQRVEETAAVYRGMGAAVKLDRFPGMPHTVSPAELQAARTWLGLGD